MQFAAISHCADLLSNISRFLIAFFVCPTSTTTDQSQLTFSNLLPSLDFSLGLYLLENSVAASGSWTCWKVTYSELLQTEVELSSKSGEKWRTKNLCLARVRREVGSRNVFFFPVLAATVLETIYILSISKEIMSSRLKGSG